jgi:hypothetical protein
LEWWRVVRNGRERGGRVGSILHFCNWKSFYAIVLEETFVKDLSHSSGTDESNYNCIALQVFSISMKNNFI